MRKALRAIARYLGAYLLGIVVGVIATPAELILVGQPLWPWYPVFALPGYVLFYYYLAGGYLPFASAGLAFWTYYLVGLLPFLLGAWTVLRKPAWARTWRPLWIAFPIGFIGTMGVYYTAAASV